MIGGTALLGPHVIRELLTNDVADVHTLTRSGKSYYCETSHSVDRRDSTALQKAITTIKPDVLIDMIPFTVEDAHHVVKALANMNAPPIVVAISSIDVYAAYASLHRTENNTLQSCPLSEDMALRKTVGPEGQAYDKLSVEAIYTENLKNLSIIRLPAIYGWPDCTRISDYLDPMLDGYAEIALEQHLAEWKFSRCFHKNAAHAIALSVLSKQPGQHIYNVADSEAFTERQWVQKIAKLCGWQGLILESQESTANWQQHFYVSTEKIRTELGYIDKYATIEGLADTVAFHAYQRFGKNYRKYY